MSPSSCEERAGAAFWAVLGPDVELRQSPTPAEVVEDAEEKEFAG